MNKNERSNQKHGETATFADFWHECNKKETEQAWENVKVAAVSGGKIFYKLMETVKVGSLGLITYALYEVGGQYRRNMSVG